MRKRWLVVPAVLLALFAILFVWLRANFTPDRLRALVEPRLEAAIGHPVELGRVSWALMPLAIRAEKVRILAPPGFAAPALAEVDAIELRPQILALLRRQLAIRSVGIDAPHIWLEQRADSLWNWAVKRPAAAPGSAAAANQRSGMALSIAKLSIANGAIDWHSQLLGMAIRAPLAAEIGLHADAALRNVRVDGWIAADTLRVETAGKLRGWRGPRLRLEPRIAIDVPESTATIESLRLSINEAVLDMQGRARMAGGRPEISLATRGESIDLAKLLAALPAGAAGGKDLRAEGTVKLDLQLEARPPALPVMHGRVDLRNGSLQMANLPDKLSAIGMQLQFAGDSLRVEELTAKFGTAPVRVTGLIMQPLVPTRSHFDLQIAAGLDLAQVTRVAPMPAGTSLAGRADVDVRARGRTARPDSVWVEGPIRLQGVEVRSPLVRQPVHAEAKLQGIGAAFRIESAQLSAGRSQLALTGMLYPALPPRRPRLEFQGQSPRLDLVELLPPQPAAGAPGAAPAAAHTSRNVPPLLPIAPPAVIHGTLQAGEVVLPAGTMRNAHIELRGDPTAMEVDLATAEMQTDQVVLHDATGHLHIVSQVGTGTLRAGRADLRRISATDLGGDLSITGRQMTLSNMHGKAYSGTLQGGAKVDLGDPAAPHYDLDFDAQRLDANAFLGSISPLRGIVSGTVDLKSGWKYSGSEPKQILSTLTGTGQAAAANGTFHNLPVLESVSTLLQLPSFKTLSFRDLGMAFDVQTGRMAVRDMQVRSPDADFGVGGSIGLDGSLDLGLHVVLSQALSQKYLNTNRGTATLGSLFSDSSGRLVFDFGVGGQYKSPKVKLDLQKTAANGGVARLTSSVVERILGKLPIQVPGLPAPPAAEDAAPNAGTKAATGSTTPQSTAEAERKAAEEAARKAAEEANRKLTDKLGGLFKRPAAVRDTAAHRDSTPRH